MSRRKPVSALFALVMKMFNVSSHLAAIAVWEGKSILGLSTTYMVLWVIVTMKSVFMFGIVDTFCYLCSSKS